MYCRNFQEKYEYRKYKARVVNESMSNLDINDSDNKKKNNKNVKIILHVIFTMSLRNS